MRWAILLVAALVGCGVAKTEAVEKNCCVICASPDAGAAPSGTNCDCTVAREVVCQGSECVCSVIVGGR